MMSKSLYMTIGVVLFAVTSASILTHFQQGDVIDKSKQIDSNVLSVSETFDWQSVLEEHDAFRREEKEVPQEIAQQKQVDILSSTLIAIVSDKPATVTLLQDGSDVPVTLTLGEGWLNGWTLSDITPDRVMWKKVDSDTTVIQFLYGSPEAKQDENELTAKVDGKR